MSLHSTFNTEESSLLLTSLFLQIEWAESSLIEKQKAVLDTVFNFYPSDRRTAAGLGRGDGGVGSDLLILIVRYATAKLL